jgi:TolB-like protein
MVLGTFGLGYLALKTGSIAAILISESIVKVSNKLSQGKYTMGLSATWAKETGAALLTFAEVMIKLKDVKNIEDISSNLNLLIKNLPNKGVGGELESIADSIIKISKAGLTTTQAIDNLAKSLKNLDDTMRGTDMASFEKIAKFSSTFTTISLIDDIKLQKTIDTIKNKNIDIHTIMDDSSSRFIIPTSTAGGETVTTINSPFLDTGKLLGPLDRLVLVNENIDKNITEILKIQKDVSQSEDTKINVVSPATRVGIRSSS